jgi:hypothetical protein
MDAIESELLVSATEVLTPLRQGVGLVPAAAERLKQALRAGAREWSNSLTITKSAANLFVDLASGIEACSYAYGGDKAEQVRAFADEVGDLVRACVAIP